MRCVYRWTNTDRGRCHRNASHQLAVNASGLADVVPFHPDVVQAPYCLDHAEKLARHLNESLVRRETLAHHRGDPHRPGACAYCTPPEQRRMKITREVVV